MIPTAVTSGRWREIIGFDIVTTEATAAWTDFLRSVGGPGLLASRWS